MSRVHDHAVLHCFSEYYQEAREKFLHAAKELGAELHELEVTKDVSDNRYVMDIAIVRGTGHGLLVISSGTHGVEGYAGSAIQVNLLEKLKEKAVAQTVAFVHAINPYGMAHFRRWNENNVDLNRNALHPHQFERLVGADTLNATYLKFDSLFNPTRVPSCVYVNVGIWVDMAFNLVRYGLRALKTALVAATYSQKRGVFFGGQELQSSHVVLKDFMTANFRELPASEVTWIDVHTGLGPCGVDVLLGSHQDEDEMHRLFPKIAREFDGFQDGFGSSNDEKIGMRCRGEAEQTTSGPVNQSAGYEFSVGVLGTDEWISSFFKPDSGRALVLTQEFGTRSNLSVARALLLENVGYHYDRDNHEYWRSFTRDAFYVRTADWKARVLKRGESVFNTLASRTVSKL